MVSGQLDKQQENALKASIKATYGDSRPGTALNKCIRFCNELKMGDRVLIVDGDRLAFAYVGEYYEENSPKLTVDFEKEIHREIEKTNPARDRFECPYTKRRRISVIKELDKGDTISPYLQNAMAKNWHGLSNLNEYAELILSGCFDTVVFGDKLIFTFRVRRREENNVLDMSKFVLNAARLLFADAAKNLEVEPCQATIIDLTSVIKKEQE